VIASLRGTVIAVRDQSCVVDVHGVGYAVNVTSGHRRSLGVGDEVSFLTTLIVREDAMTLYGFENAESQELFDALLNVSGVGPRSALAILSELTPAEALTAVLNEDDAPFRKVSGVGPKTAKLIVVQLAGKLSSLAAASPVSPLVAVSAASDSVVMALIGLGWSEKTARDAVASVESTSTDLSTGELLKNSLALLSKAQS
jgi:Holliday junction DNA helicase RuvA